MTVEQLLLGSFDAMLEAPPASARLRLLVVDLGLRGKLVSHVAEEGSGQDLLGRIRSERAVRPRPEGAKERGEPLHAIPAHWAWTTFGWVTDSRLGKMLDRAKNQGAPLSYLRNTNVQWFRFDLDDIAEMRMDEREAEEYRLHPGDLLICEGGEPGRVAIVDESVRHLVFQKALHRSRPLGGVAPMFLAYFLWREAQVGRLESAFTGSTIRHLTGKSLARYSVPLPPVEEQCRIVARVAHLWRLCDDLDAFQRAREQARSQLRRACLASLAAARTDDDFIEAWSRTSANWDVIADDPNCAPAIKQSILQLAVQGRLVRGELDAEPATELMRRSRVERDRRLASRVTRVTDDSAGYERDDSELPKGWTWAPLQDLVQFIDYRGKTPEKTLSGIPLITAKNIRRGWINPEPREYIAEATYESWMTRGFPKVGDILFTTEAPLGNAALVDATTPFGLAQRTICLSPYADLHTPFLLTVLLSPWFAEELERRATGMTATGIKASKLRLIRVPVPPVCEQQAIAARVEGLTGHLDRLHDALVNRTRAAEELSLAATRLSL